MKRTLIVTILLLVALCAILWAVQVNGIVATAINTVAFSATPSFDLAKGDQFITLTGDVTASTVTNMVAGQRVTWFICQDGAGLHTFSPPANVHGFMTIGTIASKCSAQEFESPDGTTMYATSTGVINQ